MRYVFINFLIYAGRNALSIQMKIKIFQLKEIHPSWQPQLVFSKWKSTD